MEKAITNLKRNLALGLERLTLVYRGAHLDHDPVRFARHHDNKVDAEVAGFIASSLAYGSARQFSVIVEKILLALGPKPTQALLEFNPKTNAWLFSQFYYRMNRGIDILAFLYILGELLKRYGTLGRLFKSLWRESDADTGPLLKRFFETVMRVSTVPIYGSNLKPHGLRFFFANPATGSACKRVNMFLRWMVRPNDGIDLGLWGFIPKSKLIVPLDTHVFRISRYLKFTRKKSPGWKAAKEITEALKRFDPDDPLKYDFPLCHLGMSGGCPVKISTLCCQACPLLPGCARGCQVVGKNLG